MASNETLRRELMEMRERDQEMRKTIFGRYSYGEANSLEDSAWFKAVDAENTRRMQEIIAQHGWPGLSEVGEDGAGAAWLLAQHAAPLGLGPVAEYLIDLRRCYEAKPL